MRRPERPGHLLVSTPKVIGVLTCSAVFLLLMACGLSAPLDETDSSTKESATPLTSLSPDPFPLDPTQPPTPVSIRPSPPRQPTATPISPPSFPTPLLTVTPQPTATLLPTAKVKQPPIWRVAERIYAASTEWQWAYVVATDSSGRALSIWQADALTLRVVYGFSLAPFLHPELSAEELENLNLEDFLGIPGVISAPTPHQINEALQAAASAKGKGGVRVPGFTESQYRVADFYMSPEQNQLTFDLAVIPFLSTVSSGLRGSLGDVLRRRFSVFQKADRSRPFLKELVRTRGFGGLLPGF